MTKKKHKTWEGDGVCVCACVILTNNKIYLIYLPQPSSQSVEAQ